MPYLFVARTYARSLCIHPNFQATTRATSNNFVACRSRCRSLCVHTLRLSKKGRESAWMWPSPQIKELCNFQIVTQESSNECRHFTTKLWKNSTVKKYTETVGRKPKKMKQTHKIVIGIELTFSRLHSCNWFECFKTFFFFVSGEIIM